MCLQQHFETLTSPSCAAAARLVAGFEPVSSKINSRSSRELILSPQLLFWKQITIRTGCNHETLLLPSYATQRVVTEVLPKLTANDQKYVAHILKITFSEGYLRAFRFHPFVDLKLGIADLFCWSAHDLPSCRVHFWWKIQLIRKYK
jgi:hypothetical protein